MCFFSLLSELFDVKVHENVQNYLKLILVYFISVNKDEGYLLSSKLFFVN